MSDTIQVRGIVQSGKADFSYWIEKLADHYTRKTGVRLFPGTLNIHLLDALYILPRAHVIRLESTEYGGAVSVSIVPCQLFNRRAFVLRTDGDDGKLGDPPERILEIASDIPLRTTYNLQDGDTIEVDLPV